LAIVVPAWSVALAFVAGLAVGVVACRLVMGRGRPEAPAALTAPEPVAEAAAEADAPAAAEAEAVAPEPVSEPAAEEPAAQAEPAEPAASADQPGESEDPAAAVDDVVAELERRVKGRRTEGDTDRTTGGRRGRRG
jgi:outer membrane biosynthesis protein TonB